jgi:predicted PurR-regulated permease PerM
MGMAEVADVKATELTEDAGAPLRGIPSVDESGGTAAVAIGAVPAGDEGDDEAVVEIRTVFLGGLFFFALIAVCYVGADLILPIVLAFVLMLVLQPALRALERLHIPRPIIAVVLIVLLLGAVAGALSLLAGPAAGWVQHLPGAIPKLQQRLSFLSEPIAAFQRLVERVQGLIHATGQTPLPVTMEGSALGDRLLYGTRYIVVGLFQTALVLFFLIMAGDRFLRRLVEILPRFRSKRRAVEIWQQIERDISAYLVTITAMNLAVGIATGIVAAACGLGDPLLWGTAAFLLNYVPILGPTAGVVLLLLAGLLTIDRLPLAFLPAGLYLGIHVLEGETITPMLLARRFTINPVLVIIAVIFWYWVWGVPGAILATPMLAITKIICDRTESLAAFGRFIEG